MQRYKYIFVLAFLIFALSGCRVRIIDVAATIEDNYEPEIADDVSLVEELPEIPYSPEAPVPPEPVEEEHLEEEPQDEEEPPEPTPPEPEPPIDEVEEVLEPENIEPEILELQIEPLVYESIEVPRYDDATSGIVAGYEKAPVLTDTPEGDDITYITIEDPSPDAAGDTTLDADGDGTLGLIIDHHTGILSRGLGSLFECQRLYVYLENLTDFRTVNRSSFEHALITDSGGFNVAARRGNDGLIVDAEWVQRRNPAVIIRIVDSSILGRNINDTGRAFAFGNEILNRPGFENINAVINRQVLLLSDELLQSYEGRLIAKLHIAHAMYPTLFADVNMSELNNEIAAAGGIDYSVGIFAYSM